MMNREMNAGDMGRGNPRNAKTVISCGCILLMAGGQSRLDMIRSVKPSPKLDFSSIDMRPIIGR